LIAAMHVAQPVERGWARYSMRFRTIRIPEALHDLRRRWEPRAGWRRWPNLLELWSENGSGREQLLQRVLGLTAEQRWFVRVDPGWEARDVRFYGDRWCKLDAVSVTENHGGGRLLTRVRLRLQPTLFHNALLSVYAYALLLCSIIDLRLALLPLPLLAVSLWQLASSRRRLRRTVIACLLTTAEQLGMSVIGAPDLLRRETPAPVDQPLVAKL
jgi:hypothetical protein